MQPGPARVTPENHRRASEGSLYEELVRYQEAHGIQDWQLSSSQPVTISSGVSRASSLGVQRPPVARCLFRDDSSSSKDEELARKLEQQEWLEYQRQMERAYQKSDDLIRQGQEQTYRAIGRGEARAVVCRGCQCRLQAPVTCALVFCPSCGVTSPN